jgi:hypothetical protein
MKTFANFVMSDLMDMIQSLADPYMFYNKDGKHNLVLLAVVFVDNVLLVGTEKMVKWFKTKILTRFNYTDLGKLQNIWVCGTSGEKTNMEILLSRQQWICFLTKQLKHSEM